MQNDYRVASLIGFITALIIVLSLLSIGLYAHLHLLFLVFVPFLWSLSIYLTPYIQKIIPISIRFVKFCIVGVLNTVIDFGSLNILSYLTGITSGFLVGGINIPGFVVGIPNSYFWNKKWVFNSKSNITQSASPFLIVTLAGIFINSALVILLTTYINPPVAMSSELWLNIAKVIATVASLVWNFVGFKFLVFKDGSST